MPKLYQDGAYSYEFGAPADPNLVPGMAVESLKIDRQPEFEAEGKDNTGSVIAYVVGDYKYTFSASGYLHNPTDFGDVDDFSYIVDGVSLKFIINSKNVTQSNTDFQKCEISGVAFTVIGDTAGADI